MAELAVVKVSRDGVEPAYVAADVAGDTFVNDGTTMLHVKNGGAGVSTVTIDSPNVCNQGEVHDVVIAVPAGEERLIGPFPVARFSRTVSVSYDVITTVTVAALQMTA